MYTKKQGIINLIKAAILFSITIYFASCSKDDDINIDHLTGFWNVVEDDPQTPVQGPTSYNFNPDKTCTVYVQRSSPQKDTTMSRTYVLSIDNTLVTLYDEKGRYTEQYRIVKLTDHEMQWKNGSPGDGNHDKSLIKAKE